MFKSGIYDFAICRSGTDLCFVLGFGRKRPDLKQYRISGLTGSASVLYEEVLRFYMWKCLCFVCGSASVLYEEVPPFCMWKCLRFVCGSASVLYVEVAPFFI